MSGTHHQALFTQKPTCARMVKPIGKLLLSAALVVLGVMAVLQPTPVMAQSVTASGGPTTGTAPLTVYFYANATGGMEPYTWAWDFGDGGSASSQNPIYSYSAPGTYTATVTVTDDNGSSATATVGPINVYIPVTIVPSATCGESDFNVCFSATTQGGVPPFTFDWNFGDGSYPTPNWYDPLPCHAFTSPNTSYNVTVTVHDSDGSVGYGSVALTTSPLVVSSCASPTNGNAPLVVQFNDGCGFVTGGIGPYVYDWDYGDGTLHGHDWKTQHSYNDPGTYHVTLTVTDECDPQSIVMDNHIVVNVVQGAVPHDCLFLCVCKRRNTTLQLLLGLRGRISAYDW
jgi:PKD repeat protein